MSIIYPNLFTEPCLSMMFNLALKHARFNTSPKTYSAYSNTLQHFEYFCNKEELELGAVTTSDIRNFISTRKRTINPRTGNPYSYFWLNIEIAILKKTFELAVEKNLIASNPAKKIKKFKAVSLREPIDKPDIKLFLKTIRDNTKNINYYYAIILALNSGMRKGELCYCNWSQIDFKKSRGITKNKITDEYEFFYFNRIALSVLNRLRSIYPPGKFKYIWGERPLNYRNINRTFNLYRDKLGLSKRIVFHSTRHTAITAWANSLPLHVAQDLARHSTPQQTMQYIHTKESQLLESVNSVEQTD